MRCLVQGDELIGWYSGTIQNHSAITGFVAPFAPQVSCVSMATVYILLLLFTGQRLLDQDTTPLESTDVSGNRPSAIVGLSRHDLFH